MDIIRTKAFLTNIVIADNKNLRITKNNSKIITVKATVLIKAFQI